jgi:hypothetical protein
VIASTLTGWERRREPASPAELQRLGEKWPDGRRLWAAIMLALDVDICGSILAGRRVMAGRVDGEALRRALRGERLPAWDSFIAVTAAMIDAIVEAGPLLPPERRS